MAEKKVFLIRPSFFSRSKLLAITDDNISVGRSDNQSLSTSITKDEIDSYKFQAVRVRIYLYLYSFYKIDIRSLSGIVIKIRMFSIFGIQKKRINDTFNEIMQCLWSNFFNDVARNYLDFFENNIDFNISGLIFTQDGLAFSSTSPIILWTDIDTRKYHFYYTISSKKDAYNYKSFSYWEDWNAIVIYYLTESIVNHFQRKL